MLFTLTPVCLVGAIFSSVVVSQTLHTSDRWILDSNNEKVKLRCASWSGHGETNIPEGLASQPVDYIAAWVGNNGFNCIRLTYSIDMALNPDQLVSTAFTQAASETGLGTALTNQYTKAVEKNPFLKTGTVLGAYTQVIQALGNHGVMVILDNHNSHHGWCCSLDDGNGWWDEASNYVAANSRYFNTANWVSGLTKMATYGKQFSNVVGYSLRNELRTSGSQNTADWYKFVERGAAAVHAADPEGLVVVGGWGWATTLAFLKDKTPDRAKLGIQNLTVWEYHTYSWSGSYTSSCDTYTAALNDGAGFAVTSNQVYTGPVFVSEFGWAQNYPSSLERTYIQCLGTWAGTKQVGWAAWALQGNYYVRSGVADYDETFGLVTRDWSTWRNSSFVDAFKPAYW